MQLQQELGRPLKSLQNIPLLYQHLQVYFDAFELLSSSRPVSLGGAGPISFRDIVFYLEWKRIIHPEDQLRWIRYIQAMDMEFLEVMHQKRENEEPENV